MGSVTGWLNHRKNLRRRIQFLESGPGKVVLLSTCGLVNAKMAMAKNQSDGWIVAPQNLLFSSQQIQQTAKGFK